MDPELVEHIKWAEGTGPRDSEGRFLPYTDTEGHLTIGYGHNLDYGIDPDVAERQLEHDVRRAIAGAEQIDYFGALDPVRAGAVVDMVFNMGLRKVNGFRKFHAAMRLQDWTLAAGEIRNSRYYEQTGRRARRIESAIRYGVWPELTQG